MPLIEMTEQSGGTMTTTVSMEDGGAEVAYRLMGSTADTPPPVNELVRCFDYFTGGVTNIKPRVVNTGTAGAGKVSRYLPPIHPFRPELSAAGVSQCVGVGRHVAESAVSVFGLPPVSPTFPHHMGYDLRVRFVKRPYFLVPDEAIELKQSTYYKPDGGQISVFVAEEWRRFTKTTRKPLGDTISASAGSFVFKTQTGGATPPNDTNYTGMPYLYLQNEVVEIQWFCVPYYYMLDNLIGGTSYRSYLTRFVNTINQFDWNGYPAGSLLFLGAEADSFIPPSPNLGRASTYQGVIATGLEQSLLANIKLRFLYTSRVGADVPNDSNPLLANKNRLAKGHNLLPNFADNTFRYTVSRDSSKPSFESFNFGLLFTNPLLTQPGTI